MKDKFLERVTNEIQVEIADLEQKLKLIKGRLEAGDRTGLGLTSLETAKLNNLLGQYDILKQLD